MIDTYFQASIMPPLAAFDILKGMVLEVSKFEYAFEVRRTKADEYTESAADDYSATDCRRFGVKGRV